MTVELCVLAAAFWLLLVLDPWDAAKDQELLHGMLLSLASLALAALLVLAVV